MEIMTRMNSGIFEEEDRIEEENRKAKEAEKRLHNAITTALSTKEGRFFVSWVLSQSPLDATISTSDSVSMAILSGRRDVGLNILGKLREVAPDAVDLMYKELRNNG